MHDFFGEDTDLKRAPPLSCGGKILKGRLSYIKKRLRTEAAFENILFTGSPC